jgi:hypothetical protein
VIVFSGGCVAQAAVQGKDGNRKPAHAGSSHNDSSHRPRCPLADGAVDQLPQLSFSDAVQLFLALIERVLAAAEVAFLGVQAVETSAVVSGELAIVLRVFERVALPFELPRFPLDLFLVRFRNSKVLLKIETGYPCCHGRGRRASCHRSLY